MSHLDVRLAALFIILAACLPLAVASEPSTTYIDATSHVFAPTLGVRVAPAMEELVSASFSIPVDACHSELRVAVSWDPPSYSASVGSRSVTVDTVLRAQMIDETGAVIAERTRAGGALSFTQGVPANKTIDLVLWVDVGADVSAHALVMGWVPATGPDCV